MSVGTVVLIAFLVAFIIFISIIAVKSFISPKKLSSVQRLIKEGKYAQAQKTAKALIAKNPRDFLARYWLGNAYIADKKPELAFMEFKTVNQNALFNGDIPEAKFRHTMGELYSKFNEPANAVKEYLLLTKMEPNNAENFYNVGKCYELTGETSSAAGFYQKAISLNKKFAKAHTALGYLLYRNKQYADARKEIDLSIKLSPENYSNYYYLGKILKENKDYSAAIKALEKSERDPEFRQRALIERGSCYMMADQLDNAIEGFIRAVKSSKDDSSQETLYARYFLASCYEKSHNIEKAVEQWDKIYQKNKKFRDVGAKLTEYRDIQTNDALKEYLTSAPAAFVELCKKTAAYAFSLSPQKVEQTQYGCKILGTENNKDSWMNVRKQIFLVEFYRDTDTIEEDKVRKAADELKNQNYFKAIIFSSSGFSHAAMKFSEGRPVVLIGKEKLEVILSKAGV